MSERPTVLGRTYRDQPYWRNIQRHLPTRVRLTDETLPDEEQRAWRGHSVHVDRYPRPSAPVKLLQLHGVGTNGRMMTTIVGARSCSLSPLRTAGLRWTSARSFSIGCGGFRCAP
jgi:hypothetical protein